MILTATHQFKIMEYHAASNTCRIPAKASCAWLDRITQPQPNLRTGATFEQQKFTYDIPKKNLRGFVKV